MSLPKYIVVHRKDENNVGDIASNPLQYFLQPSEYQVVDITELHSTVYPSKVPVIVGGGGLIGNEFFGDTIRDVLSSSDRLQLMNLWEQRWSSTNPSNTNTSKEFLLEYHQLIKKYMDKLAVDTAPKFIWGAGHNGEFSKKKKGGADYPSWLSEFNLVGIRDVNTDFQWVPCASCMHPALRRTYAIKNDVIFFEHKKQLIKDFGKDPIPRFINSGDNIEQTIELLGSANTIITNSYHGAYWGTLLKKKVIVVGPWSTKFHNMKHKPLLIDKMEYWKDSVEKATIYPNALAESVSATEDFWQQIKRQS